MAPARNGRAAPTLDRLAARAGIAGSYTDSFGARQRVPVATKRALLEAMGLPAGGPEAIAASLARLEARDWARMLPAARVVRAGGAPGVSVCLPAGGGRGLLSWRIEGADACREGRVEVTSLRREAAATVGGVGRERRRLPLPRDLGPGYYRLSVVAERSGTKARSMLAVVPERCYLPPALRGRDGVWGFAVQLYALRSRHNWGMGDFGDLDRLVAGAARLGAGAIGLNPLHALFPARPAQAGPYGPSSRLFLNILYIDVGSVPDLEESAHARKVLASPTFCRRLGHLRRAELVDYQGVAAAKLSVLELLFDSFRRRHLGTAGGAATARGRAFRRFQRRGGRALARQAIFDALAEHFADSCRGTWRDWPSGYRDPAAADVARFAAENGSRVEFHQYLQWLADRQLEAAAAGARNAGMAVGLYRDLALGVDSGGAETWARPELFANGASVGAPPDDFNLKGQNWGLPPVNPLTLADDGYASFIATVRANMRHAGALRVDHVMGWQRTFWIPDGARATEGAYVRYPLEDLLGLVALESHRNRCLVIGEDLGTVPRGLRRRLRRASVLSYRLLYFERDERGNFTRPRAYPRLSLVAAHTHDLPTLWGFWSEHDLDLRARSGLFPSAGAERRARRERDRARRLLVAALRREGLLPADTDPRRVAEGPLTPRLVRALYLYLASTPARLLMVHFEDLLGEMEQVNLPGTSEEHPNWRRRHRMDLGRSLSDPAVQALADLLRRMRPACFGLEADT